MGLEGVSYLYLMTPVHSSLPVPPWRVTHLFLRGLRREDFVQFERHDFALVGEVEDGVVFRVEAQHSFGVGGVLLLLTDRPDAAEHTDVTLETESGDTGRDFRTKRDVNKQLLVSVLNIWTDASIGTPRSRVRVLSETLGSFVSYR